MYDKLQQLLQKHADSTLSLQEQIELSELLADPTNLATLQMIQKDWEFQLNADTKYIRNYSALLDKVHHKIRLNENKTITHSRWWQTFQRIAAILILPLFFSFVAYYYYQQYGAVNNISYTEIQCPLGVRTKFQLPDGSTGYLNSGSQLKYPSQFVRNRSVHLIGEAFFEVVHNEEVPFHVNTKSLDIKVLGTTFNVIANNDEQTEEVVLQTGRVDVSSQTGKHLAVLKPNEQITIDTEKQTFLKKEVEATQYTGWKEGKLVFRKENMQQVARRLSRWYNAEVVVDDRLLDDYTFHATFADEPLDEILKLLSLTTPLCYQEEKRASDAAGMFEKRKIVLRIDKSKINQFR